MSGCGRETYAWTVITRARVCRVENDMWSRSGRGIEGDGTERRRHYSGEGGEREKGEL